MSRRTGLILFAVVVGLVVCGGLVAGAAALLSASKDWIIEADHGNNLHGSKPATITTATATVTRTAAAAGK